MRLGRELGASAALPAERLAAEADRQELDLREILGADLVDAHVEHGALVVPLEDLGILRLDLDGERRGEARLLRGLRHEPAAREDRALEAVVDALALLLLRPCRADDDPAGPGADLQRGAVLAERASKLLALEIDDRDLALPGDLAWPGVVEEDDHEAVLVAHADAGAGEEAEAREPPALHVAARLAALVLSEDRGADAGEHDVSCPVVSWAFVVRGGRVGPSGAPPRRSISRRGGAATGGILLSCG